MYSKYQYKLCTRIVSNVLQYQYMLLHVSNNRHISFYEYSVFNLHNFIFLRPQFANLISYIQTCLNIHIFVLFAMMDLYKFEGLTNIVSFNCSLVVLYCPLAFICIIIQNLKYSQSEPRAHFMLQDRFKSNGWFI